MIKNVHLGFFTNEYNNDPIYIELATFEDANELDYFMDYFYNDNEEIRKLFDQDISEYSIDEIEQFREVEKNSGKFFRGRISAYYFNELGQLEFLDLPNSKRKPIRDYKMLPDVESRYKCLAQIFNDAINRINSRYKNSKTSPSKGEFVHYICEKLRQASYEVSENERYYLTKYYNRQNDKNKKGFLTLIKANLRNNYNRDLKKRQDEERERLEEEKKRYEEEVMREVLKDLSTDDDEESLEDKLDRYRIR